MTVAQLNYLRAIEDRRHNKAQEDIAREQQQMQKYVADTQATSSRYATDKQFLANTYSVDTTAATQRYVADQNAETQRFVTQLNTDTSRYATDRQTEMQSARLQFDQDTQSFKNDIAAYQLKLDEIAKGAETDLKRAQIKKVTNDIEVATKNLQLQAERLGMDEEAQRYQNAYTEMRTVESATSVAEKAAKIGDYIIKWFT